jgi:hypothetical protein
MSCRQVLLQMEFYLSFSTLSAVARVPAIHYHGDRCYKIFLSRKVKSQVVQNLEGVPKAETTFLINTEIS